MFSAVLGSMGVTAVCTGITRSIGEGNGSTTPALHVHLYIHLCHSSSHVLFIVLFLYFLSFLFKFASLQTMVAQVTVSQEPQVMRGLQRRKCTENFKIWTRCVIKETKMQYG